MSLSTEQLSTPAQSVEAAAAAAAAAALTQQRAGGRLVFLPWRSPADYKAKRRRNSFQELTESATEKTYYPKVDPKEQAPIMDTGVFNNPT